MFCIPNTDLKVYVGRLPGPSIGECTIYSDKKLRVIIDKEVLTESNRRLVVFHELIHCVFDVDHYTEDIDIMNTDSSNDQEIMNHFDFYVEKVFRRLQKEVFVRKQ
jgi:Zn-dependent peptidase ImmA (M78 family)